MSEDLIEKSKQVLANIDFNDTTYEVARDVVLDEIERLKEELEIYKLRQEKALKKLNSAINHYDTDKENNAIIFTKQILEGNSIEEKVCKLLRGGKNGERQSNN